MNDLKELERLALISKVCEELDKHLGFSDKTLAEFIIALALSSPDIASFSSQLKENGADFAVELNEGLLRMIKAATQPKPKAPVAASSMIMKVPKSAAEIQYPGLSGNNTAAIPLIIEERRAAPAPPAPPHDDRKRRRDDYDPPTGAARSSSSVRDGRRSRFDEADSTKDAPELDRYGGKIQSSEPQLYEIYDGKVANIMDFGCFVELSGFTSKKEGLCHVAQIQKERVTDIKNVVRKGQPVKVKIISLVGSKMALSMKEVDQNSGKDLLPERSAAALRAAADTMSNPVRRTGSSSINIGVDVARLKQQEVEEEKMANRRSKKLSSPEMWEARQLINAGVLSVAEYPTFDADSGMGAMQDVEPDEDIDIEINDEEPPFLRGQTKLGRDAEPVRIVKNPDGSMSRAALHQTELSKERRELKKAQANDLIDAIPKDLSKPWEDPMPESGERHFAAELRSINVGGTFEQPEWKQKTQGKGLSYGQISNKTIREQRESLPVYQLKSQLMGAIAQNQVLVVIGETGSGKTTQMTQYLAEMGYTSKGSIGCTQPRRVAATSVAKRVAEEYGCELGQEVGYSIRFEDMTSPSTVIKYMTDGMLMREYLADNLLSKYICIILDEAHERTIHTDVLFGLLKQLLRKREDFKLIVTSATLNAQKFASYFNNCQTFTIPGRLYPVEILYCKEPEPDYLEAALITVMQIHLSEPSGDILVFLTGQTHVRRSCTAA